MNLKKSIIVLSILLSVSSCSLIFPRSSELSRLKDAYTSYTEERSKNSSIDSLISAKSGITSLADDLISKSPKDSETYAQAFLIKALVDYDFYGKSASSASLIELTKKFDIEKEAPWFRVALYTLIGNSFSFESKFVLGKSFYEKALSDNEAPLQVRLYALSSYLNSGLKLITEPNLLESFLRNIEGKAKDFLSQEPENPVVDLILSEIYSQLGDDPQACSYAHSALSIGLKDKEQINEAKFIAETSCKDTD